MEIKHLLLIVEHFHSRYYTHYKFINNTLQLEITAYAVNIAGTGTTVYIA